MKSKVKNRIMVVLVILIFSLFFLVTLFQPEKTFSETERRPLAKWPELTVESLLSGRYMKQADAYFTDHFPFRDTLRRVKVSLGFCLFQKEDDGGYFKEKNHIIKREYPLDKKSVTRGTDLFNHIKELYLNEDNQAAVAVIPDKNAFSEGLAVDYDLLEDQVKKETSFAQLIPLRDLLSLDDYYYTDPHWKQTSLEDVGRRILTAMGRSNETRYEVIKTGREFKGAYKGQLPVKTGQDTLSYLWNDQMENYVVTDLEHGKEIPVYNREKGEGKDPYEFFLSGPLSIVTIENKNIKEKKELVLFRDSFGSSIAPLLSIAYSKITLIDVRYISSGSLHPFVDFDHADVLFLYSASVLNHSETLRF